MNVAIVFAGGSGARMGTSTPKQFLELAGKPVLAWTLGLFQSHPRIDRIRVVAARDCFDRVAGICGKYGISKLSGIAEGGATAQDSIYSGLRSAVDGGDGLDSVVLLHDGVRPYVESDVISANIDAVEKYGNAVTYTPCFETIVVSRDGETIDALPYRRESYTAQAPQSFRLGDILAAHERIRARPQGYADMIDQATICWTLGIKIHLVKGNRGNMKITTPEDIVALDALLKAKGVASNA